MILFISIFSNTFPPTFIKIIGLNFDMSVEVSLPGFVMGIILAFFHFFGVEVSLPGFVMGVILTFFHFFREQLFLKHSSYIV